MSQLYWGHYLARGVSPSSKEGDSIQQQSKPCNNADAKAQAIMQRLKSALRNEGLTPFAVEVVVNRVQSKIDANQSSSISHLLAYFLQLTGGGNRCCYPLRSACPQLIPKLRGQPVWDPSEFPWIASLEAAVPLIQQEVMALRHHSSDGFQQYSDASTAQGHWNVCYLFLHSLDYSQNRQLCPHTTAAISAVPRHYRHAFFSAIAPNTHILPHCGPTNKKLRCFLPLFVPTEPQPACWLRAHDQVIPLVAGKAIVFDDSYEHEARNLSTDQSRIVLIFDIWHPDLSEDEVKLLEFITNAQIRAAQRLRSEGKESTVVHEGDDFLSGILKHKDMAWDENERERQIWGSW